MLIEDNKQHLINWQIWKKNRFDGVMVSVFASSVVGRGVKPKLLNWYLLLLRSSIKEYRKENNVSEWGDMHTRGLLFQ